MAVPKRKKSKSKSKKREKQNMQFKINYTQFCDNCKSVKLSHTICNNCGFYRSQKILEFKIKKNIA